MATFRYATQGGTGTFEAADSKAALAALPKDAIKGSGVQAITSDLLAQNKPVMTPKPPEPSDPSGAVANGAAVIQGMGALLQPQQTQTTQTDTQQSAPQSSWMDVFTKYFPTQKSSVTDDYQKAYKENVAPANEQYFDAYDQSLAAEQRLAGVNARLQGIQAKAQQMNLQQEGRQANMAQITGQQAENNRKAAIEALPLQTEALLAQAEVAGAQGKMQLAQQMRQMATEQLNTLFTLKKEDIDNEYTYRKDLFNALSEVWSEKEKATAAKLEKDLDRQHDFDLRNLDFEQAKALEKYKNSLGGGTVADLTGRQYTALNQITTRFQADPIVNQSIRGNTASQIADQVIANPKSATSQLKSLYVLVKNLDPDSAVREGELALANQTQSYLQRFDNTIARISEGRVVSPEAAKALAVATKELMSAWNNTAKKRQKQYESQANTLGLGEAFGEYLAGSELGYNNANNPLGLDIPVTDGNPLGI